MSVKSQEVAPLEGQCSPRTTNKQTNIQRGRERNYDVVNYLGHFTVRFGVMGGGRGGPL